MKKMSLQFKNEWMDVPFAVVFRVGVEMEVAHARFRRKKLEGEFAPLSARRRARTLNPVAVKVQCTCSKNKFIQKTPV